MKELTAKEIMIGLRKGWGIDEFIENYGYGSPDELRAALDKIHNGNEKKVNKDIQAMKQNTKRNKKQSVNICVANQEKPIYMPVKVDSVVGTPYKVLNFQENLQLLKKSIDKSETKTAVFKEVETTSTSTSKTETEIEAEAKTGTETEIEAETVELKTENISLNEENLETLNNKLSDINDKIVECEKSTKVLLTNRRAISKNVEEICQTLKKLEAEVNNQHRKFEDAYEKYRKIEMDLEDNRSLHKNLLQEKDSVESEIRELTVITVYCDSDEISLCNYKLNDIEIDKQVVKEKIKTFFESEISELLDEFSVFELKKVATMILAVEHIETENDTTNVELWFSNQSNITSVLELMGMKVKVIN